MQSDIWPEDQMLPVLHKGFAMIKQKSENERLEQSTLSKKGQSIIALMKNLSQSMNDTK